MSEDVTTADVGLDVDGADDVDDLDDLGEVGEVGDSESGSLDDGSEADGAATVGDDDGDDEDEYDEDYDEPTAAERVLESCLRAIVDNPDEIEISVDERDRRLTLHVHVSGDDMGKIIGKRGRVANALRTLIKAAGSREGYNASVEIDD